MIIFLASFKTSIASQYHLTYDGIISKTVSTTLLVTETTPPDNNGDGKSLTLRNVGEQISIAIGRSVARKSCHLKQNDEHVCANDIPIENNCVYKNEFNIGTSLTCQVRYVDSSIGIDVNMNFQEITEDVENEDVDLKGYAFLGVDAVVRSIKNELSREMAIHIVESIEETTEDESSFWSMHGTKGVRRTHHQQQSGRNEASQSPLSVESTILSNHGIERKRRLFSSNINATTAKISTKDTIEIWEYDFNERGRFTSTRRALFLDSILQYDTSINSKVHAEAFVHPSMIANPFARRVLILSASPLPMLREILKYKEVEHVEIVGANIASLDLTRIFMPELDDCSGYASGNGNNSCLDDDRVKLVLENTDEWLHDFLTNPKNVIDDDDDEDENNDDDDDDDDDDGDDDDNDYGRDDIDINKITEWIEGRKNWITIKDELDFYVIMVDVPMESTSENADHWLSVSFIDKIKRLISDDGILVANIGFSPSMEDQSRAKLEPMLEARNKFLHELSRDEELGGLDFESATLYDEPFSAPFMTSFVVAFELDKYGEDPSYDRFYRKNFAAIDLDIAERLHPAALHPSMSLKLYDGPTHILYTRPSRAWETWYCNQPLYKDLKPCTTFLPNLFDFSRHHSKTEVRRDPIKGRSLFTLEDIPSGHFFLLEDAVWNLKLDAREWKALNKFIADFPDAKMYSDLRDFFLAYGYEIETIGSTGWGVSLATNQTFTNHACDAKYATVSTIEDLTESVDKGVDVGFSPVITRRGEMVGTLSVSTRDLLAGEEITQDYKSFREDITKHPEFEKFLSQSMCEDNIGLVPLE